MVDLVNGFKDGDSLRKIRNDFLNPVMKKVTEMEPLVHSIGKGVSTSFHDIELVPGTSTIKLTNHSNKSTEIDLGSIGGSVLHKEYWSVGTASDSDNSGHTQVLVYGHHEKDAKVYRPIGESLYDSYPDNAKFKDKAGNLFGFYPGEMVDCTWFGAIGDGKTDCTVPIRNAIAFAHLTGRGVFLPKAKSHYLVKSEIIFKIPKRIQFEGTIIGDMEGKSDFLPIITVAGNSYREDISQPVYFYEVDRLDKKVDASCIRFVGLKTWQVTVHKTRQIEVMGTNDEALKAKYVSFGASSNIGAVGYCNFQIGRCFRIELTTDDPNTWVNENTFFVNRLMGGPGSGVFIKGPYESNHNLFFRGCMESEMEIFIECGSNNRFKEVRFERYPSKEENLKITFGENTWGNVVEATWHCYEGLWTGPYEAPGAAVTINDRGVLNSVNTPNQESVIDQYILELASGTSMSSVGENTSFCNVYSLIQNLYGKFKVTNKWRLIYQNMRNPIPVRNGDILSFQSDVKLWRYRFLCLDGGGRIIREQPEGFIKKGIAIWDPFLCGYNIGNADNDNAHVVFGDTSVVKYVVPIVQSGNTVPTGGVWFNSLKICKRTSKMPTTGMHDSTEVVSERALVRNVLPAARFGSINWLNVRPDSSVYCADTKEIYHKLWERVVHLEVEVKANDTQLSLTTIQQFPLSYDRIYCSIEGMSGSYWVTIGGHSGFNTGITLDRVVGKDIPAGTKVVVYELSTVRPGGIEQPPAETTMSLIGHPPQWLSLGE